MNFHQLEYIVAVEKYRHFNNAAHACFVTQATLSAMVKKLEQELNVQLFDRSKHPIKPTEIGAKIILQAKKILGEQSQVFNIIEEFNGKVSGDLVLGIIPTIAPYLLPLFVHSFLKKHPSVQLIIKEQTTDQIIENLKLGTLDIGILATPLVDKDIIEKPLYYEQFLLFAGENSAFLKEKQVDSEDLKDEEIWLLEEGHCLRDQALNICKTSKIKGHDNLQFEAGSMETLINFVKNHGGITLIPELMIHNFEDNQKQYIRPFISPVPVREVSLVTYKHFYKDKLVEVISDCILVNIPTSLKDKNNKKITPLQ